VTDFEDRNDLKGSKGIGSEVGKRMELFGNVDVDENVGLNA
jgi:hypothetical protein